MQDVLLFIRNHWLLNLALVVVLFVLVLLEFINQKRGAAKAGPAEVTRLINHSDANVVDIRGQALFSQGHIIGAMAIPVTELNEDNKKLGKLKVQPLILVDANGTEAPRAAELLIKQGYNVRVLAGGMRGWRDADMPVVKD
jgi:rhodanese-related sulfurtransferase